MTEKATLSHPGASHHDSGSSLSHPPPHLLATASALTGQQQEQQQNIEQQAPEGTAQPFDRLQDFVHHHHHHHDNLDSSRGSALGGVVGSGSGSHGGALTAQAGASGSGQPPTLATSYQQLLAQQYSYLQQHPPAHLGEHSTSASSSSLPPSSHLPPHYHASSGYPSVVLDHHQQHQQHPAHVSTTTSPPSSQEDPATSHRILMWKNGVSESYADSEHHQQGQPRSQSLSQSELRPPTSPAKLANLSSAPSHAQPQQYHSYYAPPPLIPNECLDSVPVTDGQHGGEQSSQSFSVRDEASSRPRSLTIPTSASVLSPSQGHSTIDPSSLALTEQTVLSSPSSSFPFAHPPPIQAGAPYSLHFHPPPIAAAHFPFASQSYSTQGINHRARTIDLNPAANAARQSTSFDARSSYGRTESSASSLMDMKQPLLHTGQGSQGQHTPQHTQVTRTTSGWDPSTSSNAQANAGSPAQPRAGSVSATPMRNAHARFQSASNVRGAPTEALDGSPARFSWDPHARMSTMDSIASSQWSPVVNDMYRFVDPLQPNFDFTFALDPGSAASSPMKQSQLLPRGPAPSRLSSVSSVESGPVQSLLSSGPAQLLANSSMQTYQQGYPPTHRRRQSGSISSMSNGGGQSAYTKDGFHFQSANPRQQTSQRIQQLTPVSQPSDTPQLQPGDDSESRRASTSTSTSSAPLISPPDDEARLPSMSNQFRTTLNETQFHDPLSGYLLQEPPNPYGYRDYFNDPYEGSPSSISKPLPYAGYPISKTVSPMPVVTGLSMIPPEQHLNQWNAPPIELPIAQLERQTLREEANSGKSGMEEVKRKRTTSKKGSIGAKPQPVSTTNTGDKSISPNSTLAPAQDRAYRRLSSPVLSVRPSDDANNGSISDDDDDDEDEDEHDRGINEWNSSSERSRRDSQGIQYGSYPNPGFTLSARTLSSTSAGATTFGSVPVTASSSSGSTYVTAAPDNQPAHSVPPPVDTSGLVRAVPDVSEDVDLGLPRRQKLRFGDDWYTPEWVRGESAKKEGFCDLCQPGKWLQLKNSAFWYHRQYTHGISSVSGNPFSNPVSFRQSQTDASTEALCHQCNEWVIYTSRKQNAAEDPAARIPTNWFKHAHKCHFYVANRSKAEKPRGKRRKVSSSPDDA